MVDGCQRRQNFDSFRDWNKCFFASERFFILPERNLRCRDSVCSNREVTCFPTLLLRRDRRRVLGQRIRVQYLNCPKQLKKATSRRDFLANCAKTLGGAALYTAILPVIEACTPSSLPLNPTTPDSNPVSGSATVSVSDLTDASPAKFAKGVVGPDNLPVLITRISDANYHAFSARCTHTGCAVQNTAQNGAIPCFCHGSSFALDGTVLKGPAATPLTEYTSTYDPTSKTLKVKLS